VEALEDRSLPSTTSFFFSTGNPDGKIGTASHPVAGATPEFETGDDFVTTTETTISSATFVGLVPSTVNLATDITDINIEIYRVFPKDSNVARTSGPPTFSTPNAPTRVNSPSDIVFNDRDSANGDVTFTTSVLNPSFMVAKSVFTPAKVAVGSGGDGAQTGQEVLFTVTFVTPFDLPPDHYFFVPQVQLAGTPAFPFLWLSAPKPIVAPGTPFTPDLQSWMRDDPPLAPDWLRIGTDIIGGTPAPTFNAAFSLSGTSITPSISSLSQTSAVEGSGNLTLTVQGSDFTAASQVLFNGNPLATTFDSSGQLRAVIPASFLADEGTATVSVFDPQRTLSNTQTFTILDHVPTVSTSLSQNRVGKMVTVSGMFSDSTAEGHLVRLNWGDGVTQDVDLGVSAGGPFAVGHVYKGTPRAHVVTLTVLDDEGVASATLTFFVRPRHAAARAAHRHHLA
jgi:hypothetical protein